MNSYQESANFVCKVSDNKYFRALLVNNVAVVAGAALLLLSQPFKNVTTFVSFQT